MPKPAAVTGAMGKKYKQTWCPIWRVVDSLEKLCCGTLLTCRSACFLCPPSEAVRAGPPAEKNPLGLQHRHCAQVPRGQKGKRSLTAALCSVYCMFFCLFVFLLVHKHGVRNILKYIQQLYIKYQWLTFFNAPINISHFLWIIKTIRMQIKRVRKWTDAHTDISSSKYCWDPQMHVFKKACISTCVFRLLLHSR